ncbi:trans-sialidase [Trypanosoma cruzi]|nr:trans-sialidase [Trypanosoma cruzi]
MKALCGTATPTIRRRGAAFHLMFLRASTTSHPLPTRWSAANETLTVKRTRTPTLPWARTAAPIHSAALTRRQRMASQKPLSPAQTQQLFNALIAFWMALAPHRRIRAQLLRRPRSHRGSTQHHPWKMNCLVWRMSPGWRPWV